MRNLKSKTTSARISFCLSRKLLRSLIFLSFECENFAIDSEKENNESFRQTVLTKNA